MPNLASLQIYRPAQLLTEQRIQKLILESHPEGISSDWYSRLELLCKRKDYHAILQMIIEYLEGGDAIYQHAQLSEEFIFFHKRVLEGIHCEKDSKELLKLCDLRKFKGVFKNGEKTGELFEEYTATANTFLATAIIGKVGHKENLDYAKLIKSYHLLNRIILRKKEITYAEIKQFLDKQVVLPSCFFELNKCTKKLEAIDLEKPFYYLRLDSLKKEIQSDKAQKERYDMPDPNDENCGCKGDCGCEDCCEDQNPCCANLTPFISDLMVIKEELKCYEAKHLAYIETIMLGETRDRKHRHLERTEDYSERETTRSKSEERDHNVAQRFNLQSEMNKTMESDLSIEAGVTANSKGPSYSVTATLDVASQISKSESQRVAREQAVDITDRTVRKIQETVRELKSQRRILEIEETNRHKFENSVADGGEKHINGMYQFVNMISTGQVMNYGKRLMFEFILPEPLQLYKKLMSEDIGTFELEEPVKPTILPEDISTNPSSANYFMTLLKNENANLENVELLPIEKLVLSEQFTHTDSKKEAFPNAKAPTTLLQIPEGYKAVRAHFNGASSWSKWSQDEFGNAGAHWMTFAAGESSINQGQTGNPTTMARSLNLNGEEGSIPVAINSRGSVGFAIAMEIECELTDRAKSDWKLSIYKQIMAAYEERLNAFKAAKAKYDMEKERKSKLGRNPFLNREIERTELKRMAISYISCQFYDQFSAMKRMVEPCGYPQMDLEQAEKEGKFIQFFEQLFDWNLMTYLFYPYFWGKKCSWPEKIQEDSGDPLFDKALMSGAARVQVPVRSGHEPLAMHWITFGEIWNGSDEVPTPNDPYYISMAQELKEQKGVFYADREGTIDVAPASSAITLTGSSYYWDFDNGVVDQDKIDNDVNREIIINCEVYKIISIQESGSTIDHSQWTITIESPYEGSTNYNGPWSTGALFVGAPFKVTVPTSLVYLKNKKVGGNYVTEDCLPCFPQEKCQ